jgi:endonuclease YncB( thermonuclease family)
LALLLGQEVAISGVLVGITDGNTCKVWAAVPPIAANSPQFHRRFEERLSFGQRSEQHLSELVFGREVELHTHGLDRYGRTLAVIFVNGIDANLEQVRSGMAWVYERYVSQAGADT